MIQVSRSITTTLVEHYQIFATVGWEALAWFEMIDCRSDSGTSKLMKYDE